jgi:hypothetical protein
LAACGGGGGGDSAGSSFPALLPGQEGVISLDSVNAARHGQLVKKTYDSTPDPIFGTSLPPTDLSAIVPAIVIAHGTGGVSQGREFEWAEYLNNLGIAGFVVDSFTPRGIGAGGPTRIR